MNDTLGQSTQTQQTGIRTFIASPKTQAIGLPLLILLSFSLIAGVMVAFKKEPEQEEAPVNDLIVKATQVRRTDISFIIQSQGMVKPRTATTLASEVNGRIATIAPAFVAGAWVKKGDILIQIESSDYETELKAAEANLARARASLEEEMARSLQAKREWKKINKSGVTPPALVLRKPQLANEKANVLSAEAGLEHAKRNLERTTIRAPYDGLIRKRNADLGQFITRGSELGSISATSIAEIRLPVLDRELAYLTIPPNISGQIDEEAMPRVQLTAVAKGRIQHWQGFISRTEGVIDETSRVVYLVAQIDDPYNMISHDAHATQLKFGTYVQAEINGDIANNIIAVPRYSMRSSDDVVVIDQNNQLQIRKVNVVRVDEDYVYINEGLNDGEKISLTPIENPINGTLVQIEGLQIEGKPDSENKAIAYKKEGLNDGGN